MNYVNITEWQTMTRRIQRLLLVMRCEQGRRHVLKTGGVHPPSLPSFLHPLYPPSLSPSLHPLSPSLYPSPLLLLFLGAPPFKSAMGSDGTLWALPTGFGQIPVAKRFMVFWCILRREKLENRRLVSNDSGDDDRYRRQTSVTSRKVKHNFGVSNIFSVNFGVLRHPEHPRWLRHWQWKRF